jgi:hypothetical protein
MSQKVMHFKQLAAAYGVDPRTFRKDLDNYKGVWQELEDSGFDGIKYYPKQQEIIEKHLGKMPSKKPA